MAQPANYCPGNCVENAFPTRCNVYSAPDSEYPFSVVDANAIVTKDLCDELKDAIDQERIRRADANGVSYFVDAGELIDNQEYNKLLTDLDTATYEGYEQTGVIESNWYTKVEFEHDEYSWGQQACSLYGGVSGVATGHEGWPENLHTDLTIKYDHLKEIRELINHLRTDCVCHTDCSYYSQCDCHNNCGNNYSDASLKDSFETIDGKDLVNSIESSTWKYKENTGIDDDKTHFGFVAQEIKEVLESKGYTDQAIVKEDEDGVLLIEKPYELIAILWDNVKSLNSDMEDVKSIMNDLKDYMIKNPKGDE